MSRKTKDSTPPTLAEIAKELAISSRRVSQLKELGMPVHSIEAAKAWRIAQNEGDDTSTTLRRERIRLIRLQSEKAELELSIRRNEFISRAENDASDAAIAQALRAMMASYEKEIPQLCFGASLGEAQKRVREKSRELQQRLADHQSAYWCNHPLEA